MNFKTTLILLVLLVGAGAFVVVDRARNGGREAPETVADNRKLFDVKREDVNSMTIRPGADGGGSGGAGNEIVLTMAADGKWRMTKPVEAAAENWQVDGLVRDVLELESTGSVEAKDKGLDKPKLQVELSARNGKLVRFSVGDKNARGDLYVQVAGRSTADVVSGDVYDRLSKPANELRDKQLVSVASTDVRQLTIDQEGQRLVLRKGGADWELVEPARIPADAGVVTDLLGAVTGLRVTDWVAKDSADVGRAQFDKPLMTVSFTTAAPATQPAAAGTAATTTGPTSQPGWTTITFGQYENVRQQKIFARISDTQAVVKVAATPIETLTKKPIELRDKRVLDVNPEHVSRLSIVTDRGGAAVAATKPASKTEVVVERRKQQAATTQPAAVAATQAVATAATRPTATTLASAATTRPTATAPAAATQAVAAQVGAPVTPPSVWELKSEPKGDADDDAVKALLADLHPLRVTKYLEGSPTTKPAAMIVLRVEAVPPGGAAANAHEVRMVDPGNDQPVRAEYNGLTFELPRTILTRLEGNFVKKPKTDAAGGTGGGSQLSPDDFKLPGDK
jgi:hypothetical protein